jgi:integrase
MANRKKHAIRKDGRYQRQVYIGTKPDGRPDTVPVYGKTDEEAEEKKNLLKLKLGKGIDIVSANDAFEIWARRWLLSKSVSVGDGTMGDYKSAVNYMIKAFGSVPITKLSMYNIQTLIDSLAKHNPKTKKPSSKSFLEKVKSAAKQIFDMAIDNRAIEFNSAERAKIPKSAPVSERRALTVEEIAMIWNFPHRMRTAALIMMFAGLRRGELIALMWNDIDFKANTIAVCRAADIQGTKAEIKAPKSAAGHRIVNIPRLLSEYLAEQKQLASSVFVCPKANGDMMNQQSWRRAWESYMSDLGANFGLADSSGQLRNKYDPRGGSKLANDFSAHYLRHTYSTLLYDADIDPKSAQEWVGHADIKVLLETYTHLNKTHKQKSADKLDAYIDTLNLNGSRKAE